MLTRGIGCIAASALVVLGVSMAPASADSPAPTCNYLTCQGEVSTDPDAGDESTPEGDTESEAGGSSGAPSSVDDGSAGGAAAPAPAPGDVGGSVPAPDAADAGPSTVVGDLSGESSESGPIVKTGLTDRVANPNLGTARCAPSGGLPTDCPDFRGTPAVPADGGDEQTPEPQPDAEPAAEPVQQRGRRQAPRPDAQAVAQREVAKLRMQPITPGTTPLNDGVSLVGLPTWLWVEDASNATTGPITRTARVPGLSLTMTARMDSISWSMGNGETVQCDGPGTPWSPAMGTGESPDCGYRYETQGKYEVTATAHWSVRWRASTGESGVIDRDLSSSTTIRVGEAQVINTRQGA